MVFNLRGAAAFRASAPDQTDLRDLSGALGRAAWGRALDMSGPALLDYTSPAAAPIAAPAAETVYLNCGCGSCMKSYTSFYADGVGDKLKAPVDNVVNPALLDDVGGDTSGSAQSITVGETVYAVIEDFNDKDFFSVQLTAGKTYAISQLLHVGGTAAGDGTLLSGVPLADAYIQLFGPNGALLQEADGGSSTTPSGLDAKMFFTPETSGTYVINARSFDQDSTNGRDGDHVGDYTLNVREVPASAAPLPRFYTQEATKNELLNSLDWGTQFTRTSRNPDGDNGTRPNAGAPDGGGVQSESTFGITGKNVIPFYFARQGDVFLSENPANPGLENTIQAREMLQWEKDAFYAAFAEYERVADIKYVEVDSREDAMSGIRIILYEGTPGQGASLLGRMSPPGEQNAGQTEINSGDARWTQEGVSPGGFYFPTLLHELGHGHGMKHPHDTGGGGPIMRGAGPSDDPVEGAIGGAYGDFGLSQGIFTMMSYNDGWNETGGPNSRPAGHGGPRTRVTTGQPGEVDHFGHIGTMAALDIAVIQDKYGVNEETARGDDTYVIGDVNGPGVYYRTIWDAAGTDTIRYTGARDAVIDLRAATLKYEEGGGGRVSYALGAWSGFTIANGVTIENATSGRGDDVLTGNDAANVLSSTLGNDKLFGMGGDDVLIGGSGDDALDGGEGSDTADYSGAKTAVSVNLTSYRATGALGSDTLIRVENVKGGMGDDTLTGDGGANKLHGGAGADRLSGLVGDDTLSGNAGADTIEGGLGRDVLYGGADADRFVFSRDSGPDSVRDFAAEDTLVFRAAGFGLAPGRLAADDLQFGSTATGSDAVFLFDAARKTLSFDPDGAGAAAAEVVATFTGTVNLTIDDFFLV